MFCVNAQSDVPVPLSTVSLDNVVDKEIQSALNESKFSVANSNEFAALLLALAEKENQLQAALAENEALKNEIAQAKLSTLKEEFLVHYNLGCIYKVYRHFDKAEAEFLKALEIKPDDSASHYNLGILYDDDLGNKSKAAAHYKKFLEHSNDEVERAQVLEWLESLQ